MSSKLYFNQYESPNIVIIPNMAVNDPPAKRPRIENNIILVPIVDNPSYNKSTAVQGEQQTSTSSLSNKDVDKKSNLTLPTFSAKSSWASNYLQSIGLTPKCTKSIWKHKIPRKSAQKSDSTPVPGTSVIKTETCEKLIKPDDVLVDTNKLNSKPIRDMKPIILQSQDPKLKRKSEKDSITKDMQLNNKYVNTNANKNQINAATPCIDKSKKVSKKTNVDYVKNSNTIQQPTSANKCTNYKSLIEKNTLYKTSKNEVNKFESSRISLSQCGKTIKEKRINVDKIPTVKSVVVKPSKKNKQEYGKDKKIEHKIKANDCIPSSSYVSNDLKNKLMKRKSALGEVTSVKSNLKVTKKFDLNNMKKSLATNKIKDKNKLNPKTSCKNDESRKHSKTSSSRGKKPLSNKYKTISKSPIKKQAHKTKTYKKIKLVINVICNEQKPSCNIKESAEGSKTNTPSNIDLDFLNDFNIDEIVESLDSCNQDTHKRLNDVPLKIDKARDGNSNVPRGLLDNTQTDAMDLIKILKGEEDDDLITQAIENQNDIIFGNKIDEINQQDENFAAANNFVNPGMSVTGVRVSRDQVEMPIKIKEENERLEMFTETMQPISSKEISYVQNNKKGKSSQNNSQTKLFNETLLIKSEKLEKESELAKVINNEEKDTKQNDLKIQSKTNSSLAEDKKTKDKCRSDQIESKRNGEIDIELRERKDAEQENKADNSNKQGQNKNENHENDDLQISKKLDKESTKRNDLSLKNEGTEKLESGAGEEGEESQGNKLNKNDESESKVQKFDEKIVTNNDSNLAEAVKPDFDLQKSATDGESSTVINDTSSDKTDGNKEKFDYVDNRTSSPEIEVPKDNCVNKDNKKEDNIKADANNSNLKVSKESNSKSIPLNKSGISDSEASSFSSDIDLNSNFNAKGAQTINKTMSNFLGLPFSITTFIHRGKYSTIFSCKLHNKGYPHALKIIKNPNYGFDDKKKDMWDSLQHYTSRKYLFTVYLLNAFKCNKEWYILMEYYPKNLDQVLKDTEKSFCIDQIQDYARQLVAAVLFLRNNNMVHLDIKPGHILISYSKTMLKLCGFDRLSYVDKLKVLPNVGDPIYRAPEVILGYPAGFGVDVWSTGVVLFEMATNEKLFNASYNNGILYQQISCLGYVPCDMINHSRYAHLHYVGKKFMKRFGPGGQDINLIKNIPRDRKLRKSIYNTYFQNWGHQRTNAQRSIDIEKLDILVMLLQKMLVIHPRHRIPIEFVYANQFIYDA